MNRHNKVLDIIIFSLIGIALILLLLPFVCEGYSIKYDLQFKRWGAYYFPYEDWKWWKAQGIAESNLKPEAVSWCGARGIMQLMPLTAKDLGVNPYDPEQNIQGGIKYNAWIDKILKKKNIANPNRRNLMFGSYNAGLGWILKAIKKADSVEWLLVSEQLKTITKYSAETIGYVKRINKIYGGLN